MEELRSRERELQQTDVDGETEAALASMLMEQAAREEDLAAQREAALSRAKKHLAEGQNAYDEAVAKVGFGAENGVPSPTCPAAAAPPAPKEKEAGAGGGAAVAAAAQTEEDDDDDDDDNDDANEDEEDAEGLKAGPSAEEVNALRKGSSSCTRGVHHTQGVPIIHKVSTSYIFSRNNGSSVSFSVGDLFCPLEMHRVKLFLSVGH